MTILGKFDKDTRFTIVDIDGKLFALFNLKKDGTFDEKYECEELAVGLYGIGEQIN